MAIAVKISIVRHDRMIAVVLPAPGSLPDDNGCFGPNPCTHYYASAKHGKEVNLFYQETGPVLYFTLWNGLISLSCNSHIGFAP